MVQGKTIADLAKLIDSARIPTAHRVSTLEAETETLKRQLAEAKKKKPRQASDAASDSEEDAETIAAAAARQAELAELVTAPNPINQYVEMLEEEVRHRCLSMHVSGHDEKEQRHGMALAVQGEL